VAAMTQYWLLLSLCFPGAEPAPLAAARLAERIDHHVDAVLDEKSITAAPLADDAEFIRRVHLDLIGRIPAADDVRRFLADPSPAKRDDLIDQLLSDPRHFDHFARTWRALLLPEAETDLQIDYFRPGLEAWLRERRAKNAGLDLLVRELIATPISDSAQAPEMVLRDLRRANSLGYFAAKEAKPENLAASATRLFLGVRLECAQCHDHPFGEWTQRQFWNQAAFFAGLERQGKGVFAPLAEARGLREVAMMQTGSSVAAVFLDGKTPEVKPTDSPRIAFAAWLTARDNVQFAKAGVNRVWGQLMGIGLVDPVDDFHEMNPPSHPALLDELAAAFAESSFDLTLLTGAICRTRAYQRTSRTTAPGQDELHLYARRGVKSLSGEQFLDVLSAALGWPREDDPLRVGRNRDPVQQQLLDLFSSSERSSDPHTTITQALALMNGTVINGAAGEKPSPTLARLIERRDEPLACKLDALYLATLSRFPTQAERSELVQYAGAASDEELPRRLGDVLWVLLNSVEFRCNH